MLSWLEPNVKTPIKSDSKYINELDTITSPEDITEQKNEDGVTGTDKWAPISGSNLQAWYPFCNHQLSQYFTRLTELYFKATKQVYRGQPLTMVSTTGVHHQEKIYYFDCQSLKINTSPSA